MPDTLRKIEVPPASPAARPSALMCLVLVVMLLASAVGANVVVDPRGDFGSGHFRPLVDDIASVKAQLYRRAEPVQSVILGSSRAMPLPPEALAPRIAFNFGILGGSLQDDQYAYGLVKRVQGAPQQVVIVLDTFQLRDLPDGSVWSEVLASRAAAQYTGDTGSLRLAGPLRDALSAGYLRDTLHTLDLTYRTGYPVPDNAFQPDGQGLRPKIDPLIANGTYDLPTALEVHWQHFLSKLYVPGATAAADQVARLQDLVRTAAADGAQVQVVLAPFHAQALARIEGTQAFRDLHDASVQAVQALCGPRVSLFDYTHAEAFGGAPDGFYDNYHVTPANGALLLTAMQEGRGNLCP